MSKPQPLIVTRAVMEKKYKINDGSTKHVETATLLEPANNSASNQNEAEELREVSLQLMAIKRKFDEERKRANKKQQDLDEKRKEIEQIYNQELSIEGPTHELTQRLQMLDDSKTETGTKIDEEIFTQNSYKHMLARMKKDFIASKLATSANEAALKNKQQILELEHQKQRKIKEQRLQSRTIFFNLMKNIEKEQRNRQEIIHELQTCITLKEASIQKRIERQRRNQEIAEAAANENKDSSELKMRENLLIQKLWNVFLRKKMEQEMAASEQIDNAFKAIKTETGVTDVQEMVKKFLTREQTYSTLLVNVNDSERKIEQLKTDNDHLRAKLHELKIDSSAVQEGEGNPEDKFQDEEIVEMRQKIAEQKKAMGMLQEKYKKINIVNDQVSGWAKKCFHKFAALTDVGDAFPGDGKTEELTGVFETMEKVTVGELKDLREKGKDGSKPYEHADDQFIEFATEAFIHKNIRVRPISGVTEKNNQDGRASEISRAGGDDGADSDDNNAKNQEFHLEDMRYQVKEQRRRNLEMRAKKQAAEERKAQKKN